MRRTAEGLGMWCLLYALWFAFSGQAGWATALWGAAAAGAGAAVSHALADPGPGVPRTRRRAAAALPRTAWRTVADFGLVTRVLAVGIAHGRRGPVGRFVRKRVDLAGDRAGTAALLSVVATYSPNAYAVDIDPRTELVLLHDLRPARASEEPL
ncbi:hypothetical protein [Streptomyces sediminimaris]|uniref:hypothetical protein n=1 Tax=Streptomyces sediminimaris TaxID=3383721 RepID=UPI00399B1411